MAKKPTKAPTINPPAQITPPAPPSVNMQLMAAIVAATQANSFMYVGEADYKPLVMADLVQVNPAWVNPANPAQLGVRANDNGIALVTNAAQIGGTPVAPIAPSGQLPVSSQPIVGSSFKLDDGIAIPAARKFGDGGGRSETYPFDSMTVGQSFFVPATAEDDKPAKRLASTVSNAMKRYGAIVGTTQKNVKGEVRTVNVYKYTKRFAVRAVDEEGRGKGARVWRIEDEKAV